MSGARVPYHLRTNKFVERQLFLDLLDFVRIWNGSTEYFYASMGGQFLEDFKILHERYAIDRMISIEQDLITWHRQSFNRPLGCIDCRNLTSGEFIDNFSTTLESMENVRAIVWLDYAEANNKGTQLQEYQQLVSQLTAGDVVKITLNANYQSRHQLANFKKKADFESAVIASLTKELDGYIPGEGIRPADINSKKYPELLAKAVRIAVLDGNSSSSEYSVHPLASFRYRDGQQMLTVTAIITDETFDETIKNDRSYSQWPCKSKDWHDIHEIDVPNMSQKERVFVNSRISREDDFTIHQEMPFHLEASEKESLRLLKSYIQHYRRYPAFGRVYV